MCEADVVVGWFESRDLDDGEPMIHVDLDDPRVGAPDGLPVFREHGGNAPLLNHMAEVLRVIYQGMESASAIYAAWQDAGLLDRLARERLERAPRDLLILHPGPMNRGVEIDSDVADGPHSVILDQVTNGVAVRMAVLYLLAGGRPELADAAKGGPA